MPVRRALGVILLCCTIAAVLSVLAALSTASTGFALLVGLPALALGIAASFWLYVQVEGPRAKDKR